MAREPERKSAGQPDDPPFRRLMRAEKLGPEKSGKGRWKAWLRTVLVAFALASLGLLAAIEFRRRSPEPVTIAGTSTKAPGLPVAENPPTEPAAPPFAPPHDEGEIPLVPLTPYAMADRRGFVKPIRFAPPYEPIDAASFKVGETIVQIIGMDAPPKTAICEGADKALWICGIEARVAFYYLIRAEPLHCRRAIDDAAGLAPVIRASCLIRDKDLATEFVRTGFARAGFRASRDMIEAEEEARQAGRGLWRGGWKIVQGGAPLQ